VAQSRRLGQLGRAHRRLDHRLDHHVARVARLGGAAFSSISSVRIAWSSEPQLTADPDRHVVVDGDRTIVAKCSSCRFARRCRG
jgi:hypothetical protein